MNRPRRLYRLLKGAAGLVFLAGLSRSNTSVRTMTEIHASREAVWSVLTDTASYPEWNSVITEMRGTLRPGERIRFVLRASSGARVPLIPTVLRVEDGYELRWRGRLPGLLSASHYFLLSTTSGGVTVLQHGEDYQGALVPFLRGFLIRGLTPDFEKINREVKRRAEQLS